MPFGPTTSVDRPGTTLVKTGYDDDGNVRTQTDDAGQVTTYNYDPLDRIYEVVDPDNRTTNYAYYPTGKLQTVTDPISSAITGTSIGGSAYVGLVGSLNVGYAQTRGGNACTTITTCATHGIALGASAEGTLCNAQGCSGLSGPFSGSNASAGPTAGGIYFGNGACGPVTQGFLGLTLPPGNPFGLNLWVGEGKTTTASAASFF